MGGAVPLLTNIHTWVKYVSALSMRTCTHYVTMLTCVHSFTFGVQPVAQSTTAIPKLLTLLLIEIRKMYAVEPVNKGHFGDNISKCVLLSTVEPVNKGHFGDNISKCVLSTVEPVNKGHFGDNISKCVLLSTVEPVNKGHFRAASFALYKEVVLFGSLKMYILEP